jgi:hypothetical protein
MKWFGIMMPLGLRDGECIKREKRSRDSICMLLPVATLPIFFFRVSDLPDTRNGTRNLRNPGNSRNPQKVHGGVSGNRIKRA